MRKLSGALKLSIMLTLFSRFKGMLPSRDTLIEVLKNQKDDYAVTVIEGMSENDYKEGMALARRTKLLENKGFNDIIENINENITGGI